MLTVRILSFCKMKFVRSHWSLLLIVLLVIKIREFIPESPNIMGSKPRKYNLSDVAETREDLTNIFHLAETKEDLTDFSNMAETKEDLTDYSYMAGIKEDLTDFSYMAEIKEDLTDFSLMSETKEATVGEDEKKPYIMGYSDVAKNTARV